MTKSSVMSAAQLRSVMLLVRDVPRTAHFFESVVGLSVRASSETMAEMETGSATSIVVQAVAAGSEAPLTTGYSPFLNFAVSDLDKTVYKAMELGAAMDGAIQYADVGKTASIRTPDGHMLGLHEPTTTI